MVSYYKTIENMAKRTILNNNPPKDIQVEIEKFHKLLIKNKISVEKIILFGSYAKGKQKPWSDVDLCVVSKNFGKNNYDEMVMLMKLRDMNEIVIEPHPYNPKDLEDPFDPLASEIRKYGKVVA